MASKSFIAAAFAATSFLLGAAPASAADRDAAFFQGVEGEWRGPGEIVAGKYKGTKFVCSFTGAAEAGKAGMELDGSCRVGIFNQKMNAKITRTSAGYRGKFLDGAAGKGLDVTSGNVNGDRVVFGLKRKKLDGAMLANLSDPNSMKVTISVRVSDTLVPVIGMNLSRVDSTATSAIARN